MSTTPEPMFECEWGRGYGPCLNEQHPLSWFTNDKNYDEGDRRRLAKLKPGAFLNLSEVVAGVELRHIVTRIK